MPSLIAAGVSFAMETTSGKQEPEAMEEDTDLSITKTSNLILDCHETTYQDGHSKAEIVVTPTGGSRSQTPRA